ncbi:MAG: translocation/assembly module TamB [Salinivirgaceae bacterium]|nr:translocation/assembly module TamB [Salinivirgaceae bacterium]
MIKKISKILLLIISSLFLVLVFLFFLVKIGHFNPYLAKTIERIATENIKADVKIESIYGDIFSRIGIKNLEINYHSDTVLFCSNIQLAYSLKDIFSKKIVVEDLIFSNMYMGLKQEPDSIWNVLHAFTLIETKDTSTGSFDWPIVLNHVKLNNFYMEVLPLIENTAIPKYIESNIGFTAFVLKDSVSINLDSATLLTINPDFEIINLSGAIQINTHGLLWQDAELELNNTEGISHGNIDFSKNNSLRANAILSPFNMEDFAAFFPDLKFYGSPDIELNIFGNEEKYEGKLTIKQDDQEIYLSGWLENFSKAPVYDINLSMNKLNGAYWTQNEDYESDISGKLTIKGKYFDKERSQISIDGKFDGINYDEYSFENFYLNATKNNQQINGTVKSKTWMGDVNATFKLSNIFDHPNYELFCSYKNLNLEKIPGVELVKTNLNGNISINGEGSTLENLNTAIRINSTASSLLDYPINDFTSTASYKNGRYRFDGLHFDSPYFMLNAHGKGDFNEENDIQFDFEPRNIYDLVSQYEIPIYHLNGSIKGQISGNIHSLKGTFDLALHQIQYDSIYADKVIATIEGTLKDSLYDGNISFFGNNINYNGFTIKQIDLKNKFSNNLIVADLNVQINDSLNGQFSGSVKGFENPLILLDTLNINYLDNHWILGSEATSIALNSDYITINQFELVSENQKCKVHGKFTFDGEEDISITLEKIQIQKLPLSKFIPIPLSGYLSSDIQLLGTADHPIIRSKLALNQLLVDTYEIEGVRAQINYENELISTTSEVNSKLHKLVKASLNIPAHISFNDEMYLLNDQPGFSGSVKFDSLDLRKIYMFYPLEYISLSGFAYANMNVSNTINSPMFNGVLKLSTGTFENKAFGAYYRDIQLGCNIENNTIYVNKFSVLSNKKGTFSMDGVIVMKDYLSPLPDDFTLNLKAENFQALKSNRVELKFSSNLTLKGPFLTPQFFGDIQVVRSRVNADYFGNYMNQKTDDPIPPLLLTALNDTSESSVSNDYDKFGIKLYGTNFYKHLNGQATLKIPGNTWIKGKDMNFELEGSLQAIKSSENLDLFGTLKVKRGFYKIYGKNFNFSKGELTFTGGKDINPMVNFIILYKFRDIESNLRQLTLIVTGRLMQPVMQFKLDEKVLDEKDAVAYIVFGKSVNQLSDNQKNKLMGGENMAMNFAFEELSNLLKQNIKFASYLDVVEISGDNSWKNQNVAIGKYITNNLYLGYEHTFSVDKKTKTINSEKLMLDYQLLRNVILKATNQSTNSGFDMIYKKSWK